MNIPQRTVFAYSSVLCVQHKSYFVSSSLVQYTLAFKIQQAKNVVKTHTLSLKNTQKECGNHFTQNAKLFPICVDEVLPVRNPFVGGGLCGLQQALGVFVFVVGEGGQLVLRVVVPSGLQQIGDDAAAPTVNNLVHIKNIGAV